MGLRALAYYLDRPEAVVVQSVLLDAGVLAIIANEDLLRMLPRYTLALGGYRILVSEDDLDLAIALIGEALANPIREGGELVVKGDFLDRVLSLVFGALADGAPCPTRERRWIDDNTPASTGSG
ncbi:MAG: hypothetical protein K2P58_05185 [Hyphomonadaceae bacterium]|nr:hypothetical protein [Hyphomonadaceae bacterium]